MKSPALEKFSNRSDSRLVKPVSSVEKLSRAAPGSAVKLNNENLQTLTSDISEQISRLGASEIQNLDLAQIIMDVFEEEYNPEIIKKRIQGQTSRRNFSSDELAFSTDCTGRIFDILDSFVASERAKREKKMVDSSRLI